MAKTRTAAPALAPPALLRRPFQGEEEDNSETSVGIARLEAFLVVNRSRINEWVELQKAEVDARAESHRQAALAEQSHLDRLQQDLLALQLDRSLCLDDEKDEEKDGDDDGTEGGDGGNETPRQRRLVKEQEEVEEDLERVRALSQKKEAEIEDLEARIGEQREQLSHEREWVESIRRSKATAQAELARCLYKFRNLGLVFDAAATTAAAAAAIASSPSDPCQSETFSSSSSSNALRFAFTLLDENDPDRRFEFTLATIGDDEEEGSAYELVDCDPIVGCQDRGKQLSQLVKALNETDDMAEFVRSLRQMFVEAINEKEKEAAAAPADSRSSSSESP